MYGVIAPQDQGVHATHAHPNLNFNVNINFKPRTSKLTLCSTVTLGRLG
jgi:hypothetical protein